MAIGKMVDLARTAAETKKDLEPTQSGVGPTYPYGTQISLRHEDLQKLGMGELPKVGAKFHVHGHAVVTNVSHEERQSGPPSRRVELQIRKMSLKKHNAGDASSAKEAVDQALDNYDA